jgi:hypothetical protein
VPLVITRPPTANANVGVGVGAGVGVGVGTGGVGVTGLPRSLPPPHPARHETQSSSTGQKGRDVGIQISCGGRAVTSMNVRQVAGQAS